ncbi:MAG: hypothetical protein FWE45_01830 [Firmicutes bacterium]|nr:hypothetical protein [Bacillota bacterium]
MKILFVCTGNICRSPMAEVIFENLAKKNKRKDIVVKSAGVMTVGGLPMTPTAFEALLHCGEKMGRKTRKSTLFSEVMVYEYDYVICMTGGHKDRIGMFDNVYTLDDLVGCGDINDPFMQGLKTYTGVCKQLQDALGKLYDKIVENKN